VFVEILVYKGTRLLQIKNYKKSLKYFDQALNVIQSLSKREALERALQNGDSIFSIMLSTPQLTEEFVTKQSRILNNKAVALMNLSKHEDAIECLKQVLKVKPDHVKAMNNLGDNLNSLQRFNEAIEVFDKALQFDPHRLSVLYNKGNSYLHLKRFHEAIEWYDKALQVQPNDVDSLGNKAIALYRLGCLKESLHFFEEVLKINKNDKIALKYKDSVRDELRKKELLEEITQLSDITLERKKEMDLQKRSTPLVVGIVGRSNVGKSEIMSRVVRLNLAADQSPTVIDTNHERSVMEVDGEWYNVDLIEATSNYDSRAFYDAVKKCDGFFLVYDISSKESFEEISSYYRQIKRIKSNKEYTCILVGNKVDLKNDREVTFEMARSLADEIGTGVVEISAKVPINIKFAANSLVTKISLQEKKQPSDHQKRRKIGSHNKKNSNCAIS